MLELTLDNNKIVPTKDILNASAEISIELDLDFYHSLVFMCRFADGLNGFDNVDYFLYGKHEEKIEELVKKYDLKIKRD